VVQRALKGLLGLGVILTACVQRTPCSAVGAEKPPLHTGAPPADAVGYPSRDPRLDALPGFKNPPPGYGEVPFWWWTGEDLDVDRLIWQLRELHKKGISGVQVNYSHDDTPGWPTEENEPRIFGDDWWKVYSRVSAECAKLNMGIGLSTYTLDWPRGAENLFYRLFYSRPELNAMALEHHTPIGLEGGQARTFSLGASDFAAYAYQVEKGALQKGGMDLMPLLKDGCITWRAPEGNWQVWIFKATREKGSLNPLMKGSGDTVIQGFYQKFQDNNPGKTSKGLNYFFNDELHIGLGKYAWNPDFPEAFRHRKGYSLFDVLPGMWVDLGDMTPKIRMDYADVRMSLMEERYFRPIFQWHTSRGMIFGCDNNGRGKDPYAYGDYFRATRWYSAPGHDTPGGRADAIKGKVSASIAGLYRRPRVWLEGYHSLGWGATPENLMFATRENYLYGCTLLNLHGLYYSTYGSHWEWAPPCYHFRMPYWAHMDVFLRYFERLSYLMSQGHHVCDVALIYPVAPYQAEMDGKQATDTAFDIAGRLAAAGIDFDFIDSDSLACAEVLNGRLVVEAANASYRLLIFPHMRAVRWESVAKAAAFAEAGGYVYAVGAVPVASDRAGRNDARLLELCDRTFTPGRRLTTAEPLLDAIRKAFVPDVRGVEGSARALHRKVGPRHVYLTMTRGPDSVIEFRAKGAVELWDPWTGDVTPLRVIGETATGTQVVLPLASYEANVVVFDPDRPHVNPPEKEQPPVFTRTLPAEWEVSFVPTMNNAYGDFRLPVTPENRTIGVEARRFSWARENDALAGKGMLPETADTSWERKQHGYGTQFYVLGPVHDKTDVTVMEKELAQRKRIDPSLPVSAGEKVLRWRQDDMAWRYGKEGDLGHQGYHGLKRVVTDDFLCFGKPQQALNETRYTEEDKNRKRYYLWTCASVDTDLAVDILYSKGSPSDKSHTSPVPEPAVVYLNGAEIQTLSEPVSLKAGPNPILIRYDRAGRCHFVMRRRGVPRPAGKQRLAMRWSHDPGIIRFDPYAGEKRAEWFRFVTAPGTESIRLDAKGRVQAWINGEPMTANEGGVFVANRPVERASVVALRVMPETGYSGGGVIPEPVLVKTGTGTMPLGDWSTLGILHNYSGGVCYRTNITLTGAEAAAHSELDLGRVVATAEVHINGKKAGVRVAPPWKLDVSGLLRAGENTVEVLVYSTLSNHYQTIPSRYRGKPEAGLFGPVRLTAVK
jgi:hypothetical protein